MQWKTRRLHIFLALVLLFSPLACQRYLPPPEPPAFQNSTVRIACPAHLANLVTVQSAPWKARQQAQVEALPLPAGQALDSITHADIWFLPIADLPRWVKAGKIKPLPAALSRQGNPYGWGNILPQYRQLLLLWEQTAYALPLVGEAPVLVYRGDLFQSADLNQKYRAWQSAHAKTAPAELRPPTTWEEFASLAEFFKEHHPSGKPGPSLPPLPADDAALDALFYTIAASHARRALRLDEPAADHLDTVFSFHYDQRTGKPLIAGPGFVAALQVLVRLQNCRPPGRHAHPEEALLSRQAVLAITQASTLLAAQKRADLRDCLGVTSIPGSAQYYDPKGVARQSQGVNHVPYLGGAGWVACVPKAANAEAAFDFLADLTGPERSAQTVLEPHWGAGPTRVDQLLRERWDAYDLDGPRTQALKEAVSRTVWQHGLRNPAVCLRIPDAQEHRAVLVAGLEQVLLHKGDPATVLGNVAQKWQALDQAKGEKAALADYRLSVGLLKD